MADKKNNEDQKKKKEVGLKNDTTSLSIINTMDLNQLIEEDLGISDKPKEKKPILLYILFIFVLGISLVSFFFVLFDKTSTVTNIISSLLLTIFSILFITLGISYNKQSKIITISSILLLIYFGVSFINIKPTTSNVLTMVDLHGKSLTKAIKWAKDNKVKLIEEYEYSDMVDEYNIISQSIPVGEKIKKELTVSVSEGANPLKEVMIPNMVSWDSEKVIEFVKNNYLSNVGVEYIESDKAYDTVISQSVTGSMRRDERLDLVFSLGEEVSFDEVKLIDFTNMSKFEVQLYMKKNQLNYEEANDFSKDVKRGLAFKQSVEAGTMVPIHGDNIVVTFSSGPEVKIPDFTKYTLEELTEWAIKNRIKLSISDKYDDTIEENKIISSNYNVGDIVEQGSLLKVLVSRGSLKMPKFNSLDEFYDWANTYEIPYEEEHQFSDTVKAGEVISYSYKTGEAIKNNDSIIVVISDGVAATVPDLIGDSKTVATNKLKKANLNYNFVYKNSSKNKETVIKQSIAAGSSVSSNITITVTLSNGKGESIINNRNNTVNNNTSSNTNNNNNNNNQNNNPQEVVEKTCTPCTITGLRSVYTNSDNANSFEKMAAALRNKITSQCPGITVNILGDTTSTLSPGEPVSGFSGGDTDSCQTITITIAK